MYALQQIFSTFTGAIAGVGEDGRWGEMYKGEQAVEVMTIRVMLPQQNPRQRASHRVVRSSVSEVGDADDN